MTAPVTRQCEAKSKRSGVRCGASAMKGAERCYHHLGKDPRRHMAEQELRRKVARLADVADVETVRPEDVIEHHLALAGRMRRFVEVLGNEVALLETVEVTSKVGVQTRAAVAEYRNAMKDLNSCLTDIGRLGLEERAVAVQERDSERLRLVLLVALQRLGLDASEPRVVAAITAGIQETAPKGGSRGRL